MKTEIILILNILGSAIIWHLLSRRKDFKYWSKDFAYTFILLIIALVLIKQ